MYPKQDQYLEAKKTVEEYEKRQKQLESLERKLSYRLKQFDKINFKIDKKSKEIIFAGVKDGKVLIGKSKCGLVDKYEPVIGKLIAVMKAMNEEVKDIVKLVETVGITINTCGLYAGGQLAVKGEYISGCHL